MRRAKGVIDALGPFGEPGQPAALPQRADAVAPPGQDFVRIALVADIKDQPIIRCIENIMDSCCQLDHTQASAQMPARNGNRRDHFLTQLVA